MNNSNRYSSAICSLLALFFWFSYSNYATAEVVETSHLQKYCLNRGICKEVNIFIQMLKSIKPTINKANKQTFRKKTVDVKATEFSTIFSLATHISNIKFSEEFTISREGHLHQYILKPVNNRSTVENLKYISIQLDPNMQHNTKSLKGFASIYSYLKPIVITDQQHEVRNPITCSDSEHCWWGLRTQRYAFLLNSRTTPSLIELKTINNSPTIHSHFHINDTSFNNDLRFEIYSGEVINTLLKQAAPELSKLLYANLWELLRNICFIMAWLLTSINIYIDNWGIAIILFSLIIRIVMHPLAVLSARYQRETHKNHALLKTHLDNLKKKYKGEELSDKTFELYKKHNIHPLYPLKPIIGIALQLPILVAVFNMLGEHTALNNTEFLWINDLAAPDAFIALPINLPIVGGNLHLLPLVMAAISITSARFYYDNSLSTKSIKSHRIKLYLIAILLFILFYTFPSAMVLYWTCSIFWQLIAQITQNYTMAKQKES